MNKSTSELFTEHIHQDLKAMNQIDGFVASNPGCSYQEVAENISWYWNLPDCSPIMADYILNKIMEFRT